MKFYRPQEVKIYRMLLYRDGRLFGDEIQTPPTVTPYVCEISLSAQYVLHTFVQQEVNISSTQQIFFGYFLQLTFPTPV